MLGFFEKNTSPQIVTRKGIITKTVQEGKKWRVRFNATEWFASSNCSFSFKPGDCVRVVENISATTLLIEPMT